jgi:transcriptional regulator with XRE-family HTH domain
MTPKELREWRQAMNQTQEEAARILDVTLRGYANWESGKTPIARRVELASQMLLRQHRSRVGHGGRPLLYISRTYEHERGGKPIEYYLVIARNDYEATKLVHEEIGSPSRLSIISEAVADAPRNSVFRVIGTVSEITNDRRAGVFREWSSDADERGYRDL